MKCPKSRLPAIIRNGITARGQFDAPALLLSDGKPVYRLVLRIAT
jgi:hypothetical protein